MVVGSVFEGVVVRVLIVVVSETLGRILSSSRGSIGVVGSHECVSAAPWSARSSPKSSSLIFELFFDEFVPTPQRARSSQIFIFFQISVDEF